MKELLPKDPKERRVAISQLVGFFLIPHIVIVTLLILLLSGALD